MEKGGMKEIVLKRSFLKNPINSIVIMVTIALLLEGFTWAATFDRKFAFVQRMGGTFNYVSLMVRSLILPEIVTLFIVIKLINTYHSLLRIEAVEVSWKSIFKYEIRLLPLLCLSFFIFNPFTQTIRFITEVFPNYSIGDYVRAYILGTYTLKHFIIYLTPVLLIGYLAVNGSLLIDYLNQRTSSEVPDGNTAFPIQPAVVTEPEKEYLTTLKGRNHQGDMIFPVEECYYFTIEDRSYYLIHPKGKYVVSKTLNDLETELSPRQFFRVNRGYILNRTSVQSYAHWEKGKYIIRLNVNTPEEIILPRARLQEFREWLAGRYQPKPSNGQSSGDSDDDPSDNNPPAGLPVRPDRPLLTNSFL